LLPILSILLILSSTRGVVWKLAFGGWVLLQPERMDAYEQVAIRPLLEDEHQCGCLMEERL
jgi:hypothetical protein